VLPVHKQHRILVVDDEYVVAITVARILCSQGFKAIPFTKTNDALEAARSNPQT